MTHPHSEGLYSQQTQAEIRQDEEPGPTQAFNSNIYMPEIKLLDYGLNP